ncbi:MAG TPA: ATP-binding cassette domain-containing protein [Thermomicrobiales bacterium]|nr:ATP-binding cassette domain-containing protein [Thermomicrobiales bacterium]
MRDQGGATPGPAVSAGPDDEWGELGRRIRFLSRVGLFQDAPRPLLTHVAAALKPVAVGAGQVVCREGEPGDQFFLIESGTLAVVAENGGAPRDLARLGPGEFFGEMALLGQGRRSATIRAESPAQLWALGSADFSELLAREPAIDSVLRRAAHLRESAATSAAFEVEHRNLAALAEGRQQIRIGRGPDNDLVFNSRLVSRDHAVVEWGGAGYRIRDLGSGNGTFVNGREVRAADLQDGDEIWIANERFVFDRREIQRVLEPRGIRIDVTDLAKVVKGGKTILNDIALSILPGEFVAIVGGSGAGKSTLMDAMSGVRPATGGRVLYNGRDYYRNMALYRNVLGYVPQDDIIHTSLPVRTTLRYAARLRLPADTPKQDLEAVVDQAIDSLGLTNQATVRVGALSGGQRKRSSIGVELLTQPRVFFLDEPTSGLDPATETQMMRLARRLADDGSTVILTTHATKNVMLCDKVVFLARGGYLAFVGTPRRALHYFGCAEFDEIYERLAAEASPEEWAARFRATPDYAQLLADQPHPDGAEAAVPAADRRGLGGSGRMRGLVRQFAVLTQRNFSIFTQSRAALIPLLMQPVIITILVLALFHSGAFDLDVANPATPAQVLFFLAFAAFQFGLFDGIQEIAKEFPIFYRERMVNLAIVPYVTSKAVTLAPILILSELLMLGILWVTGRMPSSGLDVYAPLLITLLLTAFASLALGLFMSAVVARPEQTSQIMPALILPQVLFSGAILAVPSMNIVGQTISRLMITRWSFEALGHSVDLNALFEHGTSPIGKAARLQYGDSFSRAIGQNWIILAVFLVAFYVLACLILWRKSTRKA